MALEGVSLDLDCGEGARERVGNWRVWVKDMDAGWVWEGLRDARVEGRRDEEWKAMMSEVSIDLT